MPTDKLKQALTLALIDIYGPAEGMRAAAVMLPGIRSDFTAMLRSAAKGSRVSEEYKTEDLRARIVLTGRRDQKGNISIDGLSVNGRHQFIQHGGGSQ